MKVLHLLKKDLTETEKRIVQEHGVSHEVVVFDLREEKDFGRLVDLIADSDKVISW